MIQTFPAISRLHRVPVPHTNEAVYALTQDGRRWIAKREADMGCESLLAEALTWLLAREIGAPVPDAAFCDDPEERAWLSACVAHVTHWMVELADRVSNPEEAGAILALDVWVLNEARHARNLLLEGFPGDPTRMWAIDADEALVGHVEDYLARLDSVPSVHNHARGLPISRMAAGARAAARKVSEMPSEDVRRCVLVGCSLAGEPRSNLLADAVLRRAIALPAILDAYILRLEALR